MSTRSIRVALLFSYITLSESNAQFEQAIWMLPQHVIMDHRFEEPTVLDLSPLMLDQSLAAISNTEGELLAYGNNAYIRNALHEPMVGGEALATTPGQPRQPGIILPHPGQPGKYFMVAPSDNTWPQFDLRMFAHGFDVNANSGQGAVDEPNILLLDSACASVIAIPLEDESGYWIVLHHATRSEFHLYRLDHQGLNLSPVISPSGVPEIGYYNAASTLVYMRPTQDGSDIVWARPYFSLSETYIEQFCMDRTTGTVSGYTRLDGPARFVSLEPSPSGQFIYAMEQVCQAGTSSRLWQYDLMAGDPQVIASSKVLIDQALVLGPSCMGRYNHAATSPNGRIYFSHLDTPYLTVIHQPDLPGTECDLRYLEFSLFDLASPGYLPNLYRTARPKTGISSLAQRNLHIAPNPAFQEVRIALPDIPAGALLQLADITGRFLREEVLPAGGQVHTLARNGLAPGTYHVRIVAQGLETTLTGRIIWQ